MNARNLYLTAIAMLVSCSSAVAQSFNTISSFRPSRKAERIVAPIQEEESLDSDTSMVEAPLSTELVKEVTKQTEQIKYPLMVSYPLRQSKLHVSSPYGYRRHPILKVRKMHNGVDLRAKREPVYAMLPGTVVKTGYDDISGNYVTLQHASMRVSYCHLSVIGVKKGDAVYAGQPLGVAGTTGRSTGVHLHLTLRVNDKICDPMLLLNIIERQSVRS